VNQFSVDATALAQQAQRYLYVARMVAGLHQGAETTAATYAGSWGDDEAGAFFGLQYLPIEQKARAQLGEAVKAVQDMADAVYRWAQSYPATDENLR
jgi:hypothetical protein